MKKQYKVLVFVLILVITIVGCGNKAANSKFNIATESTSINENITSTSDAEEVLVERIEFDKTNLTGVIGDTINVSPHLYPTFVKDTTLEGNSSDESIATVDKDGNIVLTGAGSTIVTVTETNSGTSSEIVVAVKAPVETPPVEKPADTEPAQPQPKVEADAEEKAEKQPTPQVDADVEKDTQPNTGETKSNSGDDGLPFVTDDFEAWEKANQDHDDNIYTSEELMQMDDEEHDRAVDEVHNWNW